MYCPNCFSVLQPGVTRCSHCSFDTREYAHSTDALPLYTSLNDQYMIGRVLGQGGFGITYKALDTFKNRVVAIKEYMPSNYAQAVRWCRSPAIPRQPGFLSTAKSAILMRSKPCISLRMCKVLCRFLPIFRRITLPIW